MLKIKFETNEQRLISYPSKTLYFTRVAKAASSSIIGLFNYLQWKNEFKLMVVTKPIDYIIQPDQPQEQKKEILKIVKSRDASVTARHYSFLDFEKFGFKHWMPDFFGMIRDPVNRLISGFYYQRAAWNIVAKMEMFPQFRPPTVQFLRQDFESCVLRRK